MIGPFLDRNLSIAASADMADNTLLVMPAGTVQLFGMDDVFMDDACAEAVIGHFNERGVKIPIDYEHATKHKAAKGEEAIATGWINSLEWQPARGLVAHVEWSERARGQIQRKEYQYISPHFDVDAKTRRVDFVRAVALTNTPRIHNMEALIAASLAASDVPPNDEEILAMTPENRLKLCAALGLGNGAKDTEIIAQIEEAPPESKLTPEQEAVLSVESELLFLKRTLAEAGLVEADATLKEVLDKVVEIIGKTEPVEGEPEGEPPPPEETMASITGALGIKDGSSAEEIVATINERTAKTVPVSEFRKLESQVATLTTERDDRGIEEVVASFVKQGRININSTERMAWARNFAKRDPKGFKEVAAGLPVLYERGRDSPEDGVIKTERETIIASALQDHTNERCTGSSRFYVNVALDDEGMEHLNADEIKAHSIA